MPFPTPSHAAWPRDGQPARSRVGRQRARARVPAARQPGPGPRGQERACAGVVAGAQPTRPEGRVRGPTPGARRQEALGARAQSGLGRWGRRAPSARARDRLGARAQAGGPSGARAASPPPPTETAAKWRCACPYLGPSPTSSSTWTASFSVGTLRPHPARAVRAWRGQGARALSAGAAGAGARDPRVGVGRAAGPRRAGGARGSGAAAAAALPPLPVTARRGGTPAGAAGLRQAASARSRRLRFPVCTGAWRTAAAAGAGDAHLAGGILRAAVLDPPGWGRVTASGGIPGALAGGALTCRGEARAAAAPPAAPRSSCPRMSPSVRARPAAGCSRPPPAPAESAV